MKISIITISYNSAKYIDQTIQSVVSQTYAELEYIIIDGGSTDGTVDIIKKYEDSIDKWVSEPDNGIADAMNKGLAMASGDYVIFIHSDDYLLDSKSIERAADEIDGLYDFYIFPVVLKFKGHDSLSLTNAFGVLTNFKMGSCHQGHFIRQSLFNKNGYFDPDFKICMDYDFTLRCYRKGAKAKSVDFPVSAMRIIGISSRRDWPSLYERFMEEKKTHRKNCPFVAMGLVYAVYWLFYPLYCRIKSLR